MLEQDYDAIFVGTGAPRGRDLPKMPGREEARANIHIGINWLAASPSSIRKRSAKRVIVLGGGNTAMDCCRTSRRLGGEEVKVIVRSPFADMKASPWEKEDAMHEDIPIIDNHVPKSFVVENGQLKGMMFEKVEAVYDEKRQTQTWFRRANRGILSKPTTFSWQSDRKTLSRGSSATSVLNSTNGKCRWWIKRPFNPRIRKSFSAATRLSARKRYHCRRARASGGHFDSTSFAKAKMS